MAIRERLHEAQGEPVWEIAHLFPAQGEWTVEDYLTLDSNHLIEYANGCVEVLPMPSLWHQEIVFLLQRMLWEFVTERGLGKVWGAPLPVEYGRRNSANRILSLSPRQKYRLARPPIFAMSI